MQKLNMKNIILKTTMLGVSALTLAFALSIVPKTVTKAASTTVVTPTNTQGWSTADTRPGGNVSFVSDPTSPYPSGALQLSTDNTNTAKAQYIKALNNDSLSSVNELSYWTRQITGPAVADPSYQLLVDLNGSATGGFTTFVYEPYYNGTVVPSTWQEWNVATGQLWSSRSFSEGTCTVVAGGGGAPFYTLEGLKTACPNAEVIGFGVNVGSYNPGYTVLTDGVNYNGTVYDFELYNAVKTKNQCKNDGYKNVTDENGNSFKNQGQCVSYVENKGK